jgi:hypothetical protein
MNNHIKIIIINIIVSFSIAVYGTFRCNTTSFKDPLTTCVADNKEVCQFLDGWGILHFFYFMVLGYFFPQNLTTIFVMGVLWEMIESYSADHPFYLSKCKYVITTDDKKGWWYGRWQDVVMNTLGMFCGYYLANAHTKGKKRTIKKRNKKSKN